MCKLIFIFYKVYNFLTLVFKRLTWLYRYVGQRSRLWRLRDFRSRPMSGQWESLFGKFCHVLNDLTMNFEVFIINFYENLKYLILKISFIYERFFFIFILFPYILSFYLSHQIFFLGKEWFFKKLSFNKRYNDKIKDKNGHFTLNSAIEIFTKSILRYTTRQRWS